MSWSGSSSDFIKESLFCILLPNLISRHIRYRDLITLITVTPPPPLEGGVGKREESKREKGKWSKWEGNLSLFCVTVVGFYDRQKSLQNGEEFQNISMGWRRFFLVAWPWYIPDEIIFILFHCSSFFCRKLKNSSCNNIFCKMNS